MTTAPPISRLDGRIRAVGVLDRAICRAVDVLTDTPSSAEVEQLGGRIIEAVTADWDKPAVALLFLVMTADERRDLIAAALAAIQQRARAAASCPACVTRRTDKEIPCPDCHTS